MLNKKKVFSSRPTFCIIPDHIDEYPLGLVAYRIISHLCAIADKNGRCNPSYKDIMKGTNIRSTQSIAVGIKQLVEAGLINKVNVKEPGSNELTNNLYTIVGLADMIKEAKIASKREGWSLNENYYQ